MREVKTVYIDVMGCPVESTHNRVIDHVSDQYIISSRYGATAVRDAVRRLYENIELSHNGTSECLVVRSRLGSSENLISGAIRTYGGGITASVIHSKKTIVLK